MARPSAILTSYGEVTGFGSIFDLGMLGSRDVVGNAFDDAHALLLLLLLPLLLCGTKPISRNMKQKYMKQATAAAYHHCHGLA